MKRCPARIATSCASLLFVAVAASCAPADNGPPGTSAGDEARLAPPGDDERGAAALASVNTYPVQLSCGGRTSAGHFTTVTGLNSRTGVVTLSYGASNNSYLFDWFQTVAGGEVDRRNCSVTLADEGGGPSGEQYALVGALPILWQATPLSPGVGWVIAKVQFATEDIEHLVD